MRSSASTAVTAQFISSILAARQTPLSELAETVAIVAETVSRLLSPAAASPPAKLRALPKPAAAPVAISPAPAAAEARTPEQKMVAPQPVQPVVTVVKRGRKPRALAPIFLASEEPEAPEIEAAPPTPRLLRRSHVTPIAAPVADPFEKDRAPGHDITVKGVVKWFDTRSSKGVLRLTGMAGDIPLDSDILTGSRIKRLYKDQEVEVTGDYLDGRFHPKSLSVPGQTQENHAVNGQVLHSVGRQSRPVFVEVKRVHPRLQSARAEAEHALGRGDPKSGM